ncbi:unnamed protein product [Zymoseptoria tritici ST99CH_1A5]|uniref:Uncharacterized protein n=1 Tax=Zymoseptoria tritici ST99CH_1A5 TaxID=1276529 RepID=A0A1Y6LPU0_ZYMTR|nr:unnamed protein product [Zymoseptoria tritici ST99CH_1A5]
MAAGQYLSMPVPTLVDVPSVLIATFTESSQQATASTSTLHSERTYPKATTLPQSDNMRFNNINNTANDAAAMPTSAAPQGETFRFPTPFQIDPVRDNNFLLAMNWADPELRAAVIRSFERTHLALVNNEPHPGGEIYGLRQEIEDLFSGQADRDTDKEIAKRVERVEAERLERAAEEGARRAEAEEAQPTEVDEEAFALANPTSPTYAPRSPSPLEDPWTPRYDPISPGTPLHPYNHQQSPPLGSVSAEQDLPRSVRRRRERDFDSISPFLLPARLLGEIVGQVRAPKRVHETRVLGTEVWGDDRTWYRDGTVTPYHPLSPEPVIFTPYRPMSPRFVPDSPNYSPMSPDLPPDSPQYVPASPNNMPALPSLRTILNTHLTNGLIRPTVGMASSSNAIVTAREVEASYEFVGEEYRPTKRRKGVDGQGVAVAGGRRDAVDMTGKHGLENLRDL